MTAATLTSEGTPAMTAPARITRPRHALLTAPEAERAADLVKVLAASRGLSGGKDLFDALTVTGHPGTYSSLLRFLNSGRVPTYGEIESLARFFAVAPEYLTSRSGQARAKRPAPRLIEFDLPPVEAAPEGPEKLVPIPAMRRPARARAGAASGPELAALADAVSGLTAVLREQMEWQKTAAWGGPDHLRAAG